MSYRIEVTAPTVSELAGKLLALAATMQAVPADPVMPEIKDAPKPKAKKAEKPVGEEAGKAEPASSAESPSPTSNSEPDTKTAETAPLPSDATPEALSFEKDVTPLVLQAVKVKGKPWVQSILAQFGVERASQVPDAQLGELVALIKEGL